MKHTSKLLLTSLLFANCSIFAAAPVEGWYWGLIGGVSHTPDVTVGAPNPLQFINLNNQFQSNPSFFSTAIVGLNGYQIGLLNGYFYQIPEGLLLTENGTLEYNVGGDFGGQLGFRVCNFRVEGELLFNYSPFSMVKVFGASIKRHVTLTNPLRISGQTVVGAGLLNGYYDFYDEEDDPTWVPYVGLGVGYSFVRNTLTFTVPFLFQSTFSVSTKNHESAPIGQAILGLSYYYSDDLSVGLDYRYMTSKTISSIDSRLQIHSLNLNFNYYFTG